MVSFFLVSFYNDKYEKKIRKQVTKAFNIENFERELIPVEGLRSESSTEIFLVKNNDKALGYFSMTEATGCAVSGCSNSANSNEYEVFYILMIFDLNAKIQKVKVLEYDSEYGYEVMAPGWLRQFEKNKKEELVYNQDIDGITGATKSANSVTHEVNVVSKYVRKLHGLSDQYSNH